MALADEFKTLQELHETGKLTDQEFADAKTTTLRGQEPSSASRKFGRFIGLRAIPLMVLLLIFLTVIWYHAGTRNTAQLIASAVHAPITEKEDWTNVRVYENFNATKTKTYRRTGQLSQGSYYLVMRDTSLGILSARASDVSVKVQLNP